MSSEFDSIRAAQRVVKSARLRAAAVALWAGLTWLWSIVAPFAYVGAGWVAGRVAIAEEVVQLRIAVQENTRALAELQVRSAGERLDDQRDVFAIGRQAAYAAAGFQAHEPQKLKEQKRAYAEKYRQAFESIARDKGASVAMASLFENVNLP